VDRVAKVHDVSIVSLKPVDSAYDRPHPYEQLPDRTVRTLIDVARRYKPDLVHGHQIHRAPEMKGLRDWPISKQQVSRFSISSILVVTIGHWRSAMPFY
jgi:hypothetical protein